MRKLIIAVAALCVAGCTGVWERGYRPGPGAGKIERKVDPVVREVPWERLETFDQRLYERSAKSDVGMDDWDSATRAEVHADLIRALQLPGDAAGYTIVGESLFTTTQRVDPNDGELAALARKVGADYAIWSRAYLGKTDRVVYRPTSTFGTVNRIRAGRDGRYRSVIESYTGTSWTPVVVRADEHAWRAFFVRRAD